MARNRQFDPLRPVTDTPRSNRQSNPLRPDTDAHGTSDIDYIDIINALDYNDPATVTKLFGLPTPLYKTPTVVRREAQQRSSSIHASYQTLNDILVRHESTIQRRWSKKTKQQRLSILLKAWPGMATMHRPDFDAFRRESVQDRWNGTKYKERFMWPYINQEDLLKPKSLLLFLNARGRHHPSEFAAADIDAMHLGLISLALAQVFLNGHTMILHGATKSETYGQLLAWDDHPIAADWMDTLTQFQAGEGLLILEAQEKILGFLVNCTQQILHDIPAGILTTDVFTLQPEPHLKSERDSEGLEYLSMMAAEAPYRVPAQLDLGKIESLLQAMVSAAKDHIWALREDPGYFAEQMFEIREHRQENLKDIHGAPHPDLKPGREEILWARVVDGVVSEAYLGLEVFTKLHQQAHELHLLHTKYASVITPEKDLPREFLAALLKFRHYLSCSSRTPLELLRGNFFNSPPLQKFFVRTPLMDGNQSVTEVRSKPGTKISAVEQHLISLIYTLAENGSGLLLLRQSFTLDELDRLVQANPGAKELVSARVAGMIGNLSIISQCLSQLDLFQPWARRFREQTVSMRDEITREIPLYTDPCNMILAALDESKLSRATKQGDPSDNKFFYPVEKRRTRENTEILRQSEQNLDNFWATIDGLMHAQCGNLGGTAVRQLLTQPHILKRTAEWFDVPVSGVEKSVLPRPSGLSIDAIYKSVYTPYLPSDKPSQINIPAKTKTKTRGEPSRENSFSAAAPIVESAVPEQVSIPVDARALKVFRTLFFDPAVTSSPGEVSWNDFLYAMTSTGMFAAEKLYGSVWQFQRIDGDDQSRIQFHEPHPRGKIPFIVARRHGRRLNRAFGWSGNMFVLAGK